MATANEQILDASTLHAVRLEGYKNEIVRKMIAILNKTESDLNAQLTIALKKLEGSTFNIERIDKLLKSTQKLSSEVYASVNDDLLTELKDLTVYETEFQQDLFKRVIPAEIAFESVVASQVYAAAIARPFSGKLLSEWMAGVETDKAVKIRDAVRLGVIEGQTVNEIVNRIRGTKALAFKDGLIEINKRNAEAIVRTAVAHVANFAREAVMLENEDIMQGEQYVSVLDGRTTPQCQVLDGKIFPVGEGAIPPIHINCRSTRVAVLKSWQELGLDADETPVSTRASMNGQVPDDQTYGQWLRKQDTKIQVEVLGVEKAKLFRDGGLTLDKFVSPKGHVYTLNELRSRNAEAFNKIQTLPSKYIRNGSLNEFEKSIEAKFYNDIDKNPAKLIRKYEIVNGNVIDPDKVKELNSEYRKNRDLVAAVHEPSSYLSKQIFTKKLNDKRISNDLEPTIFTAGGSGSGKSATMPLALKSLGAKENGLVYDSVLSTVKSAKYKIDEALSLTGGNVAIVYTNTPLTTALAQNALRSRAVSVDTLADAHIGASNTIRELAQVYKNNPRVNIEVINNLGKLEDISLGSIDDVFKYNPTEVKDDLKNAASKLYKNKIINEKRYNLLIN